MEDDIFVIWKGSQAEFKLYMDTINSLHETIKFTHKCSDQEKNRSLSNILVRAKISLNQHLYIPLQQVDERLSQPTAELKLQQLETLWIKRLATMQPKGMNYVLKDTETRTWFFMVQWLVRWETPRTTEPLHYPKGYCHLP